MNAPLARLALRLSARSPWRTLLLVAAVATAAGWLGARTMAMRAIVEQAEAAATELSAVLVAPLEPGRGARCAPASAQELGAIAGVRAARMVVECRAAGVELDVGRAEEAEAVAAEASALLGEGWSATTRARLSVATIAALERDAGIGVLSAAPVLLGMLLVVLALGHGGTEARDLVGKLKLVGMTSRQVAWLLGVGSFLPCLAGALLGLSVGVVAVHANPFDWRGTLAGLGPMGHSGSSALLDAVVAVAAFVLAPCAAAVVLPAIRLARADPARLLEGG
jgi:hypothetical protein